jgi:hypothetical protein
MGKAAKADTKVHGLDIEKLNPTAIAESLEKCGISTSSETGANLADCVELLKMHFADIEKANPKDIASCDNCGADSSASMFDVCPFCGVGEDTSNHGDREPEPDDVPENSFEEDGPGDPDDAATTFPVEPVREIDAQGVTVTHLAADASPAEVTSTKLVKLERGSVKKADKKAKKAQLEITRPAELVAMADLPKGLLPEPVLDQQVAEFKKIQRGMAAGGWLYAKAIVDMDIAGVWKRRKTEDGKVAHKNYAAFCKVELGLASNYVNDLQKMKVGFTEQEFTEIGPTKLRLVLSAAPEEKAAALAKAKSGASRREIARGLGHTGPHVDSHKDKPKVSTAGKLTVALVEGKKKLPFVVKVGSGKDASERPAKQLTDKPYARFPLTNDTVLWVTLAKNADGEIIGTFDVRRVDPSK